MDPMTFRYELDLCYNCSFTSVYWCV